MEKLLKVISTAGPVLFFLLNPLWAAAEDLGGHLLSRIEQKALAVQSYKAHFDLWMRVGGEEFSLTGTTLFKWPKMLRVEMALRDQKEIGQILYWKGKVVWQYLPSANVAFHREEETLRKRFPDSFASQDLLNIQDPFDLLEGKTIRFLEEERMDGETMYVFEGIPKRAIRHQGVLQPAVCRMWIADRDGLLRDLVMYDGAGREIVKQHFWEIQPNLELLEEEFVFKPEDVKLVEVTKETEKKMELLMREEETP